MAAVAAGGGAAVAAIAAGGATDRAVAVVAGGPTAEAAAVNVAAAAAAATDLTQSLFSIIPIFSCLELGLLKRLSSLDTSSRHQQQPQQQQQPQKQQPRQQQSQNLVKMVIFEQNYWHQHLIVKSPRLVFDHNYCQPSGHLQCHFRHLHRHLHCYLQRHHPWHLQGHHQDHLQGHLRGTVRLLGGCLGNLGLVAPWQSQQNTASRSEASMEQL